MWNLGLGAGGEIMNIRSFSNHFISSSFLLSGSINGRANIGQRPGIAGMKHLDTKL